MSAVEIAQATQQKLAEFQDQVANKHYQPRSAGQQNTGGIDFHSVI